MTKCRGLPNLQWFAKLEYVFSLALREMSNFVEFLEPWYFTIPDDSQIGTRRVGKRGVSESVMFLTPVTRRVMTSHALGTLIAACQRLSRVWYLAARIYFVVEWMYFAYLCPCTLLGNHKRLCSFVPSEFYSWKGVNVFFSVSSHTFTHRLRRGTFRRLYCWAFAFSVKTKVKYSFCF